ncbi:hypothetical protein NHX12_003320 [Muraenolepis orangiensis]|uniref:Fork-head domain-containing protein n=1 Tax=Muraenolepis orangiensis TaxID=630683 RepID=A0A9Q0IG27_9TELE|nr:hypothetical protein NHX12_003320 [Muraenolepis orangiensis]
MAPQQTQQTLSAGQLQALVQQQALLLQQLYKKHPQQLQLQLPQQHPDRKVKEQVSPPQLMFQQLLLRLQHYQQELLGLQRPTPPCLAAFPDFHQIWKELVNGIREDRNTKKDWTIPIPETGTNSPRSPSPLHSECGSEAESSASHRLYGRGVCHWPGCESVCKDIGHFLKHLESHHTLDDRSAAQCRVQMEVVQQLHLQGALSPLNRPRARWVNRSVGLWSVVLWAENLGKGKGNRPPERHRRASESPGAPGAPVSRGLPRWEPRPGAPVSRGLPRWEPHPGAPVSRGLPRWEPRPGGPVEDEFEVYRNTDIRPPFTYATLIRQAIMAASEMQPTLNEIYNWFTRTFAFFRHNAATWKNAVRHNLSLHKCFVRVENLKGAVWTVDQVEFRRRRSQKITRSPSTMKHASSCLAAGFPSECIPGGTSGHRGRSSKETISSSPHVQQPLSVKEEVLSSEEQVTLVSSSPCSTLNDP